jgi:hypothetical protein
LGVPTTLIEIDSGGNENSQIVILMRIPLLSEGWQILSMEQFVTTKVIFLVHF